MKNPRLHLTEEVANHSTESGSQHATNDYDDGMHFLLPCAQRSHAGKCAQGESISPVDNVFFKPGKPQPFSSSDERVDEECRETAYDTNHDVRRMNHPKHWRFAEKQVSNCSATKCGCARIQTEVMSTSQQRGR